MAENPDKKTIVVAGDVVVDWFEFSTPSPESQDTEGKYACNWETYPVVRRFARPGGALLLAEFIEYSTGADVVRPPVPDIQSIPPDRIISSFATLERFKYSLKDPERMVFRLKEWKGFSGSKDVKPPVITEKVENADMLVLDDASNGFRDRRHAWAKLLENKDAWIVLKMSRPLGEGELWQAFKQRPNPKILIVEADDLRMMDVNISRCLSWERTAEDFAWQMAYNRHMGFLKEPDYLVVKFGADGAILSRNKAGGIEQRLFFDPRTGESQFGGIHPGKMCGIGNAFTAGFVARLLEGDGEKDVDRAVKQGIACMKRLWQEGFGGDADELDYRYGDVFGNCAEKIDSIADAIIPPTEPEQGKKYWCILEKLPAFMETIAVNYVLNGKDESLDRVPVARFGYLTTLDRSEIESFCSIKNLVGEYIGSPGVKHPLCVAVFGPPGSGKSFGVTEVVKSVAPGKVPDEPLEFNLSQFNSLNDLINAFHKVHDKAIQNTVPLVFFDEFDSGFSGELGWLKYFLAPMQDGSFRDGADLHPLGRAIFVFAGGTSSTFEEFSNREDDSFKNAKGSDFISRLRGYINIKGPDPMGGDMKNDRLFMIRRAIVLRFLLQKHAPHIFRQGGKCHIDKDVLHAFLKVPKYRHGIRSMEATIEMSSLAGRRNYEQSALPSPEQLNLHIDADAFQKIIVRYVIFRSFRDGIAREIHEQYRRDNKGKKPPGDIAMRPWEKLPGDFREANYGQADHIPEKLREVNCDFAPLAGRKEAPFKFEDKEIELLAELEHQRFVEEKLRQGWVQGKKRDNSKKIRTDLVPWEKLDEETREYDRNAVRAIPLELEKAGLQIYRIK